jgi:hypothetical protein
MMVRIFEHKLIFFCGFAALRGVGAFLGWDSS